jgi:hypothetical protein
LWNNNGAISLLAGNLPAPNCLQITVKFKLIKLDVQVPAKIETKSFQLL